MDLDARLNRAITGAIAQNRIVGAVTLVCRHGEIVHESVHGLLDREAGTPMRKDAIFRLSSLTKPIVAATVLAMVDEGLIALDEKVTTYLPYFTPALADGSVPAITIRHLLTHSSGLSGHAPPVTEAEIELAGTRWHQSLDWNMQRLAATLLAFAPGTSWRYGLSTELLGAVAAKLVGGTLGDAAQKYVTGPLRMADTGFGVIDRARLAAAYGDHADGPELMGHPHHVPSPWGGVTTYGPNHILDPQVYHSGGGGMAGTAEDYMRLLEALRTGDGRILSPEITAAGFENQIPHLPQGPSAGWHFGFFGAVLTDADLAGTPQHVGTSRWGGIYGHTWFIDRKAGLSVVAMTNTGLEGSDGAYPFRIRDAIYAQ